MAAACQESPEAPRGHHPTGSKTCPICALNAPLSWAGAFPLSHGLAQAQLLLGPQTHTSLYGLAQTT